MPCLLTWRFTTLRVVCLQIPFCILGEFQPHRPGPGLWGQRAGWRTKPCLFTQASQNRLFGGDVRYPVLSSSVLLTVGKEEWGMELSLVSLPAWILAFHWEVPIGVHFSSCSGTLASSKLSHKANSVPDASPNRGKELYFFRQGVDE